MTSCPICRGEFGPNVRCHGATREQVLAARAAAAADAEPAGCEFCAAFPDRPCPNHAAAR